MQINDHLSILCKAATVLLDVPFAGIFACGEAHCWHAQQQDRFTLQMIRGIAARSRSARTDVQNLLVTLDASCDPLFRHDPLFVGGSCPRFYAEAALHAGVGQPRAILCIADRAPRLHFNEEQVRLLRSMATFAETILKFQAEYDQQSHETIVLSSTLDSVNQGIVVTDALDRVLVHNHQANDLLDLPRDLVLRQKCYGAVVGHLVKRADPGNPQCSHGADDRIDLQNGRKVEIQVFPTAAGGMLRTFTDATAQHAAELAARDSERRYRLIAENASDIVVHSGFDLRRRYVSPAVTHILGYEPSELIGNEPFSIVHPADVAGLAQVIDDVRFGHRNRAQTAARYRHRHGHWVWLEISFGPTIDPATGRPDGYVATARDITARRQVDEALQESEARYRTLAETLPQTVLVSSAETEEVQYENRRFQEFHGPTGLSMADRSVLTHPDDIDRVHGIRDRILAGEQRCEVDARLRRHDGVYRWHKVVTAPIVRDGTVVSLLGTSLDIDDMVAARRELERANSLLRVSEERLALALDAGNDGLFDIDLKHGTSWVSHRWLERLGYDPASVDPRAQFWLDSVHPDDVGDFVAAWDAHLAGTAAAIENEHRLRRADGSFIWVLARARVANRDPNGCPLRLVGSLVDISRRKEAEMRIIYMAEHDAMTDLPNCYMFRRHLDRSLHGEVDQPHHAAVLVCDLDRFKTVNDTLGRIVGDRVLCAAVERFRIAVGSEPLLARLGGDEFAVIIGNVGDEAGVHRACEQIIDAFNQPILLDGHPIDIGISIGAVPLFSGGLDTEEVLKRADIALFQAKSAGRNTFSVYEAVSHARVAARSLLALDMKEAIRRADFFLAYQPIVDAASGAVVSCEALMRWRHPTRGLISPEDFIPVAEETGMIVQLGRWALAQACRDAISWPDTVRVAVNVSTLQLRSDLEAAVAAALGGSGLAPSRLKLEITESALTQEPDKLLDILNRLRAADIRVSLDDFGTGYSSLNYLRRFSFDEIKIDRSFIRDITDPGTAAIIRAIVGIGVQLGMVAIAEGVENREQLDLAHREGCAEAQGFLFSPPLQAGEIKAYIAAHSNEALDLRRPLPAIDDTLVAAGPLARSRQIRQARMRLGWSRAKLACESDVDLACVILMERFGTVNPADESKMIAEVAKYFKIEGS